MTWTHARHATQLAIALPVKDARSLPECHALYEPLKIKVYIQSLGIEVHCREGVRAKNTCMGRQVLVQYVCFILWRSLAMWDIKLAHKSVLIMLK